jgi:hypothetical protein
MKPAALVLMGAAVALSACNSGATGGGRGADSRICTPFPEATTANGQPASAAPPADPAAALDDCLHRWGYTLAISSDDANPVAQATVAACTAQLASWNQQGLSSGRAPGASPIEAPSLLTGAPSNTLAEHFGFAQSRALFYVVQARAGKCAAPRTRPGEPASR